MSYRRPRAAPGPLELASVLGQLAELVKSAGWDQEGGRLIRDAEGRACDRTTWIPRAEWWSEKPPDMTEARMCEAIAAALEGRKLQARQRRHLMFIRAIAAEELERRGGPGRAQP